MPGVAARRGSHRGEEVGDLVAGQRDLPGRVRARACLGGMLSGLERMTSWSLAEHAGEVTPDGMQRLFTAARWDAGGVQGRGC